MKYAIALFIIAVLCVVAWFFFRPAHDINKGIFAPEQEVPKVNYPTNLDGKG